MEVDKEKLFNRNTASELIGVTPVTVSVLCRKIGLRKMFDQYVIYGRDIQRLIDARGKVGNHSKESRRKPKAGHE